jgi:hypothetical protein
VRWGKDGKKTLGWWHALCQTYGVEFIPSVPYASQTNGVVERRNRELVGMLRSLMAKQQSKDWVRLIPLGSALLNEQMMGTSNYTPAELFLGRCTWIRERPTKEVDCLPTCRNFLEVQRVQQEQARAMLMNRRTTRRDWKPQKGRVMKLFDWVLVH